MKADLFRIPLVVCLLYLLIGCSPIAAPSTPELPDQPPIGTTAMTETQATPIVPTQGDEVQTDPSLPIPAIPGLQSLVEKAREDLGQRLSISRSQISVIETQKVFWADASLGCPQPGVTYAQVTIPGYLIILESNGDEFEYHANIHNHLLYCENPSPPVEETPAHSSS